MGDAAQRLGEVFGPETLLSGQHKGIGPHTAKCIAEHCGTIVCADVVTWFHDNCLTAKEVREHVRACCPNANGGKEIVKADGSLYTVPHVSEGASCALLDMLINHGAFEGKLMDHVRQMRAKMRGYNTTAASARSR